MPRGKGIRYGSSVVGSWQLVVKVEQRSCDSRIGFSFCPQADGLEDFFVLQLPNNQQSSIRCFKVCISWRSHRMCTLSETRTDTPTLSLSLSLYGLVSSIMEYSEQRSRIASMLAVIAYCYTLSLPCEVSLFSRLDTILIMAFFESFCLLYWLLLV